MRHPPLVATRWNTSAPMPEQMSRTPPDVVTSDSAAKPRYPWLFPGVLVLVAFGFRTALGPIFTQYGGDTPQYTLFARNLAAGHGYSVATHAPYVASDIRLPAYPALLGVAFFFSGSHWSVIVLNALLGAVATLFVWFISRGVGLSRAQAMWATGISALFLSTASVAGSAQSENLSVPAVLAFVYFVFLKPPKSRAWLFIGGSLLAWLLALTRDELVVFAIVGAIVAARRAGLRIVASVALVACFLLGSGVWVIRNEVQVHRSELVDPVMTEQVLAATMNGNLSSPAYVKAESLIAQPTISPAERSDYQHMVSQYVRETLEHHPVTFVEDKVQYFIESLFPIPLYTLTYVSSINALGWAAWSGGLLLMYAGVAITTIRWWRTGRRRDVISLLSFPVFILCFEIVFDPQYRFWYPAVLLMLPMAIAAVSTDTYRWLLARAGLGASGGTSLDRNEQSANSSTLGNS